MNLSAVNYFLLGLLVLYKEVTCGIQQLRIVHGDKATLGNYPYQVSLQMYNQIYCGGFIIDKYHVLTAAHCITNDDPKIFSVVVGSVDLNSKAAPGTRYQVLDAKVHEGYKYGNGWPNDIALLRLAEPIVFNKYVKPAVLPKRGEQLKDGLPAMVSGFGQLNDTSSLSPILYKTKVFIESNSDCDRYYNSDGSIRPTNICTRHPNKITGFCRGDSGGPLTYNGKVVGIVSWSDENGCAGESMSPQVYTRVSEYIDWIDYWRNAYA